MIWYHCFILGVECWQLQYRLRLILGAVTVTRSGWDPIDFSFKRSQGDNIKTSKACWETENITKELLKMRYGLRPSVALYSNNQRPKPRKESPETPSPRFSKSDAKTKQKIRRSGWVSKKTKTTTKGEERKGSGSRKRKERHLFFTENHAKIGRDVSERETSRSCWSDSSWISSPVSALSSPSSSSCWHAIGRSSTSGRLRCWGRGSPGLSGRHKWHCQRFLHTGTIRIRWRFGGTWWYSRVRSIEYGDMERGVWRSGIVWCGYNFRHFREIEEWWFQ